MQDVPEPSSSSRRRSPRTTNTNPYDLPSTSRESNVERAPRTAVFSSGGRLFPEQEEADLSVTRVIAALQVDPLGYESDINSPSLQPPRRPAVEEMVEESPAGKPGSGRRRRVQNSSALASAAKRHDAMLNSDNLDPAASSSPLAQKSRRSSTFAPSARSARSVREVTRQSLSEEERDDVDELSPDRPRDTTTAKNKKSPAKATRRTTTSKSAAVATGPRRSPADDIDELSPSRTQDQGTGEEPVGSDKTRRTRRPEPEQEREQAQEQEEAQEIDENEAAATLGRKRRRQRPQSGSPDLGSKGPEEQPAPESEERPAKKKRGRPSRSPATQKQPAVKPRANAAPRKQQAAAAAPAAKGPKTKAPQAKAAAKSKDSPKARQRRSGDDENVAFEVTVQRFVNHKKRGRKAGAEPGSGSDSDGEEGNDDTDPLQLEIPFANRTAESPVDVFAQLCEEVIGNMLVQFEEHLHNETDAAKKKEVRVKIRAVEAYREELNLRLLQHVSTRILKHCCKLV